MNLCVFDGRLVRDPEKRDLSNNGRVVNFTLAVRSPRKTSGGELTNDVSYIDCEAWDSAADLIADKYKKGDALLVNCTAKTDKWQNQEGQTRTKTKFRVNSFQPITYGNHRVKTVEQEVVPESEPVAA